MPNISLLLIVSAIVGAAFFFGGWGAHADYMTCAQPLPYSFNPTPRFSVMCGIEAFFRQISIYAGLIMVAIAGVLVSRHW